MEQDTNIVLHSKEMKNLPTTGNPQRTYPEGSTERVTSTINSFT